MNWDAAFPPRSQIPGGRTPAGQTPAERARALTEREQAAAAGALARFEALSRGRDENRRRVALHPLGTDPRTVAPAGWSGQLAAEVVAAAGQAQSVTPESVRVERQRLLWLGLAKIAGALGVAGVALTVAVAMISAMAG